jgi:hypothetical protein
MPLGHDFQCLTHVVRMSGGNPGINRYIKHSHKPAPCSTYFIEFIHEERGE